MNDAADAARGSEAHLNPTGPAGHILPRSARRRRGRGDGRHPGGRRPGGIFGIDLKDGGPPAARKRPAPLALRPRSRQALAALRAEIERQDE